MDRTTDVVAWADAQAAALRRSGTPRGEAPGMPPEARAEGGKLAVGGMEIHDEDATAVPADLPWPLDRLLDDGFEPESRHRLG